MTDELKSFTDLKKTLSGAIKALISDLLKEIRGQYGVAGFFNATTGIFVVVVTTTIVIYNCTKEIFSPDASFYMCLRHCFFTLFLLSGVLIIAFRFFKWSIKCTRLS